MLNINHFFYFFKCNDSEFSCTAGTCISLEKRCDGFTDCEDLSDEEQCILVLFDDNYKVENPPMQSDGSGAGHLVKLLLISYFFKGGC